MKINLNNALSNIPPMRKLYTIFTFVLLITMIYIPFSTHAQDISFRTYTDKQTYLDTDTIILTYLAYDSGGRVLGGGHGTWFLNDSTDGKNIVNGTFSGSHGEIKIPLKNYNFTMAGSGRDFKLTSIFTYNNDSKKAAIDVIIVDSRFLLFQVTAIPDASGFYPSSRVTLKISSPVTSEKIDYLSISHNSAVWKNITNINVGFDGTYYYSFIIPTDWKNGDFVTIISRIGNSTANTGFYIGKNHNIYLTTSSTTVLSGSNITITAHYQNISSPYFHFYVFAGGSVIYRFFTTSNQVKFQVPYSYQGYLDIQCQIFNATMKLSEENTMVTVKYGNLRIESDYTTYTGGERLKIFASLQSNVIKNPTYIYTIYSKNKSVIVPVKKIITNATEIGFTAANDPPDAYIISVTATNGVYSAHATTTIQHIIPIHFSANIITDSAYTTSIYTPGEKIEIHYTISGMRASGFLYYGFGDSYYSTPKVIRLAGNTTGDIEITIPKNIPSGFYLIHMRVVSEKINRELVVPISVSSNPPWSQYMILTLPAADFVTLVIVLTTALAAVIYVKYGKKEEQKDKSKSTEESL